MQATEKDGRLSTDFYLYNDQLFQFLNTVLTPYGVSPPSFTNTEVLAFPSTIQVGTIWYNSTLDKLQFKGSAAVQTITSV